MAKVKHSRRQLNVPMKVLIPIGISVFALTIIMAFSAPDIYRVRTDESFAQAQFVSNYKDQIYNYGTHPQLRTIRVNSSSYIVEASKAGRRIAQILQIRKDGQSSVTLFAVLSGILGSTLLSILLISSYVKGKRSTSTNIIAVALVITVIFINWTNVLYRSMKDIQEFQPSQPFIQGTLSLLNFIAIQENSPELLDQLLKIGTPVDSIDNQRGSYMHHIAETNRSNMFALLLNKPGIALDGRNDRGQTPIQIATDEGYLAIVKLLLDNDVDPINKNSYGETLLHRAARNGDKPLMALLLQHVDTLNAQDTNGITPLSLAVQSVDMEMIHLLLDNGTDVNIEVDDQHTFFELILSETLEELQQAYHYTLEDEDRIIETISKAVGQNAILSRKGDDGKTLLHRVTRLHDTITQTDENNSFLERITFLLLENGADHTVKNDIGGRAVTLEHVIRHNYDDWLEVIIEVDPQYLNHAQINDRSLFQYAIERGKPETLAVLFKHGLKPKEWRPKSLVPLKFVVEHNDLATARLLLEQNLADLSVSGGAINTPLHLAASLNQDQMIELLLKHGYGVNQQGIEGNTPLHYAVETGSAYSILALLENGADPLIWNSEGVRPIDLARELGVAVILDVVKNAAKNFNETPAEKQ